MPSVHPNAAYLLHAPGHYLALVPTKLGYLLCDSLGPLPYVLTANDASALLSVFHTMQHATGHMDMATACCCVDGHLFVEAQLTNESLRIAVHNDGLATRNLQPDISSLSHIAHATSLAL